MWSSLKAFYDSADWAAFRDSIIAERGFTCQHCGKMILSREELTVHHIEELTMLNVNDVLVSLNPDNVLLVHAHPCHDEIHQRFGYAGKTHVFLVYGPPLAGKLDYVRRYKGRNDIVADMDMLYRAVTLLPLYDKPQTLIRNVRTVYDALLDNVRTRNGKWRNAFIVGGFADRYQRERTVTDLGAEAILVDPGRDVCMARLHSEPGIDAQAWARYIDEWYAKYAV